MDSSAFPILLDERFREIEQEELADQTDMIPMLFTVVGSDRATERFGYVGELGDWGEFVGTLNYDALYEQYNVVATHRVYSQGLIMTRELHDDDLTGLFQGDMFRPMIRSGLNTRQVHAARVFNFANSNDLYFYTHSEGVALVSAAHTTRTPGVSTATGYSNLTTSALTPTSFSSARIQYRRLRNDRGKVINAEADELWCGLDVGPRAREIVGTPWGLDTNTRNVNPYYQSAKVMEWFQITDTNNWFLANSKLRKANLRWYDHTLPEFRQITDFETLQLKYGGYMRHSWARRLHVWVLGAIVS